MVGVCVGCHLCFARRVIDGKLSSDKGGDVKSGEQPSLRMSYGFRRKFEIGVIWFDLNRSVCGCEREWEWVCFTAESQRALGTAR